MRVLVIGANSYIAKAFIQNAGTEFSIHAIKRDENLRDYFDLSDDVFKGTDAVINFAAIVHNKNPDPGAATRINAKLPLFLAQKAKENGVKHFVQISSIAVYGSAVAHINAHTTAVPDTIYGRTKLQGDTAIQRLHSSNFRITIVRPPLVYGPDAPGNMHSLIKALQRRRPLPFAWNTNKRSILYANNFANALKLILLKRVEGTFLLRDSVMPSLHQLCKALKAGLHTSTPLFALPAFVVKKLVKHPFFRKLYGDLLIDDSHTRRVLGEYASFDTFESLKRSAKESRL